MAHGAPVKRRTNNNNNVQDNNTGDNNIEIDEFAGSRDGGWGWIVVIASFLIHIISKSNIYVYSPTLLIFLILPNIQNCTVRFKMTLNQRNLTHISDQSIERVNTRFYWLTI